MERHEARVSWWRRAFRGPVIVYSWIYAQARTWATALMAMLNLSPRPASRRGAGGEGLGLKSLFSRLFQTSNFKLRTSSRRSLFRGLIHEPLEARQLLAIDLVSSIDPGLVSVTGNQPTLVQSISANGTKVAFQSSANNLVANDTNGWVDIFVKDMTTGEITLVSTGGFGQANGFSANPSISADGTKIAFQSSASNLVANDTNGSVDIFVKDMFSGAITLVTQNANSDSYVPSISADGNRVAFESFATNLVAGDTNNKIDVFVKDLLTNSIKRVTQGNSHSQSPMISGDGGKVVYRSDASDLTPSDNNQASDVFVWDYNTHVSTRVSTGPSGEGNGGSWQPSINHDGTRIAFYSHATNLVATDPNGTADVFIKDLVSNQITLVSTSLNGPSNGFSMDPKISSDGTKIVFTSLANNLVANDVNGYIDVFLKDLVSGTISLVSGGSSGQANGESFVANISADGNAVGFASAATNLVPQDANNTYDVFLKIIPAGELAVVSSTPNRAPNGDSLFPVVSGNGSKIAFVSKATNIHSLPADNYGDVFLKDLTTGALISIDKNSSGVDGNAFSADPAINVDGSVVAFRSYSSNLVAGDTNNMEDVFLKYVATGNVRRISTDSQGLNANGYSARPSIDNSGTKIAFMSNANNLVANDTNSFVDIFLKDTVTDETQLISTALAGAANGSSSNPKISSDGTKVVFQSDASNLVDGDTNETSDIFVKDLVTGVVSLVSKSVNGLQGNGFSADAAISGDGNKVVFTSLANNLVPGDNNGAFDIFVKDLVSGEIVRVSKSANGIESNGGSGDPSINFNGTKVVFSSSSSNLVTGDVNGKQDVFLVDLALNSIRRLTISSNGIEGNGDSSSGSISASGARVAFSSQANNLHPNDLTAYWDVFTTDFNSSPASAIPNVVFGAEDIFYVFTTSNFSFTDADAGDALSAVKITLFPTAGLLQWNNGTTWVAVTANQVISASDINAGKLRFVPAANANGTAYATFQFKVIDTNGPAESADAYTMTINVTPDNDPASVSVTPESFSIAENASTASSIKVADIVVSDIDGGVNGLTLSGNDANYFTIVDGTNGPELHIAANAALDFETKPQLNVTVNVTDQSIGSTPQSSANFQLSLTDSAESITVTNSVFATASGNLTIKVVNGQVVFVDANNNPVAPAHAVGNLLSLTITGRADENDTLTIDMSGTNPIPSGVTLTYDGGTGGNDTLRIIGSSVTYTPSVDTFGNGSLALPGNRTINFQGLEPVDITGGASVAVTSPANASNALLLNAGTLDGSPSTQAIVVTGNTGLTLTQIESAHLNGNTSVTIDTSATAGAGTNTITVASALTNAHANNNLTLKTNSNGSVAINAAVTVSGSLVIDSSTVTLSGKLTATSLSGTAMNITVNPGGSIADAVAIAAPGATINVAAGTYNEDVDLSSKPGLQLIGAGAASTTISGVLNGANETVLVGTNNTLKGFTITRALGSGENNVGVTVATGSAGSTITENILTGNRTAIYLNGGNSQSNITRNTIDNNRTGILLPDASGYGSYLITENSITNNRTFGVLFNATTSISSGFLIHKNNISGNYAVQLENNSGSLVNASGNWWGTANPVLTLSQINGTLPAEFAYPGPASPPSSPFPYAITGSSAALVDFSPTLASGTDTAPSTPGFQPDLSNLIVQSAGAQSGTTGRIQEAINLLADGSLTGGARKVEVNAGTYDEIFVVNKSATIDGTGAVNIVRTSGSQQIIATVNATNVTIRDLNIQVNQTNNGSGQPIAPVGIGATATTTTDFNGLILENNTIASIGDAPANWSGSPGLSVRAAGVVLYDSPSGGIPTVTLTNNNVNITSGTSFFQRAVWLAQLNATITGNTFAGAANDLLFQFASGGTSTISNNNFNGSHITGGGGLVIGDPNADSPIAISNNNFNPSAAPALDAISRTSILVNRNAAAGSPISIFENTFNSSVIAVDIGGAQDVSVTGNTFNAKSSLTANGLSYTHIRVNSQSASNNGSTLTPINTSINGNAFSGASGSTGTAIAVLNTLASSNFTGMTVGATTDNTYNSGITTGVQISGGVVSVQDTITGTTAAVSATGGSVNLVSSVLSNNTTGVAISGNATLTVGTGNSITGGVTGLSISGATAALAGNSIGTVVFSGQFGNYITLASGALDGSEINATAASFDGVVAGSGTTSQLYTISDKIVDSVDLETVGLVRLKANSVLVTPNSFASPNTQPSIQRAIDAASTGDTVYIQSGAYVGGADAASVNKNLTLSAGTSPGQVTINGNLLLNAGDTLIIEANGVNPLTQYDNLVVTGNVTITGATLALNILSPYTPAHGDQLTIISATGTVTGDFANTSVNLASRPNDKSITGTMWDVAYTDGIGVVLTQDLNADVGSNLSVTVPTINNANQTAVPFTLTGLDSDAVATLTFTSGMATVTVNNVTASGTVDLSSFVDGASHITVTMSVVDNVNNIASVTPFTISKDIIVPLAPVVQSISTDTGLSNTDGKTSDNTLVFNGTAEANSSVAVEYRLLPSGAWVSAGTVTANGAGQWSTVATPVLADGNYEVRAQATDIAGNTSLNSALFSITVETVAPEIIAVTNPSPIIEPLTPAGMIVVNGTISYQDYQNVQASVTLGVQTQTFSPAYAGPTIGNIGSFGLSDVFTADSPVSGTGAGVVNWTFTVAASDINFLAVGQTLTRTRVVTLTDAIDTSKVSTYVLSVTIIGTNDTPVISSITTTNLNEQTNLLPLTANIPVAFADADLIDVGHTATVIAVTATGATSGLALTPSQLIALITPASVVKNSGATSGSTSLSFSAASTAFDYLAAGQVLTLTYTVAINDGESSDNIGTQTFTINITGTNDAPVLGFVQKFETDTAGVVTGGGYGAISGPTTGLPGATGNYAVVTEAGSGPFTRFGGYTTEFINGQRASVDVYLDTSWATNDSFQYSVAANNQAGTHRRDFAFLVRCTGSGSIEIGSANGASQSALTSTLPNAVTVSTSGWYTLSHIFNDVGGVLSVDLILTNRSTGASQLVATLSDPSDLIATVVGGVRYGWFTDISVPGGVAIDNLELGVYARTITEVADGSLNELTTVYTETGVIKFSDVDLTNTHTVAAVPAAPLYIGVFTPTVSNVATGSGQGAVSWTFTANNSELDYLAAGETLVQTYIVTVTDNNGGTSSQIVVITITGTNDTPDITVGSGDSAAATLAETNAALSTNGTLTVVDLDLSNTVVPTVQSVVPSGTTTGLGSNNAALLSMLSVSPASIAANVGNVNNLSWSFASGSEFFDYLAVGESLTLTYTIRVTDNAGATDDQEVTITITGTNDTPDITVGSGDSAAATLAETNAALSTNGTLTVVDLDLSNTVVPTVQSVVPSGTTTGLGSNNAALLSMLSVSPASIAANVGNVNNLSWSFASGSEFFDYLAVGESLTLTYTIRVTDNAGATDDQEVTITITGTNDTPDITVGSGDSAAATLAETNAALSTNGTLTVVDLDLSNTVVPTVQSVVPSGTTTGLGSNNAALLSMLSVSPASIAANVGNVNNLSWSFASGSEFFDYLAVGESLTLTYTIRVTDNAGATDDQEVTITITGTNDTPDITVGSGDSAAATLAETNAALSTNGTLTVVDLDLSNTVVPTVQSVVPSGTTTGLGSNNAALLSMLSVSPASIAANVGNVNNLSWSFASGSEFFDYLAVGESLTLTYTIRVTDNAGATDDQEVTITITGTNDTPDITVGSGDSAAATLAETNAALSTNGTLTVVDLDLSNTVVPTVQSVVPSGTTTGLGSNNAALLSMLSVSPASIAANVGNVNNLSWSFASGSEFFDYLAVGESLTLTYTIRVTDNAGATDDQEVTITITGTNDTPDITVGSGDSAAATLAETNAALSTNGTLTVVDLDLSNTVVPTVQSVVPSGTTTGLGSNNAALLSMLSVSPASIAANVGNVNNLSWSFASGSEFFDYLAVGESLTLTYTIRVTDNAGATDDQEVTITITGTNDTPDITVGSGDSAAATLAETNAALSTNGTLTVVDLDLSNTVVPTVQSVVPSGTTTGLGSNNAALLSMLSVSPASIAANVGNVNNLSWSFASGSEFFDYLAVGESLTLTYTIRVTDNAGATDDQEVTITITGTNDTPDITVGSGDSAAATLAETNAALSTNGTLTVVDLDLSNTVVPTVQSVVPSGTTTGLGSNNAALLSMLSVSPASIAANVGNVNNLSWSFASGSEFFDYLAVGESLTLTYTIRVTDNAGATDDQEVTITITGTNDTPDITVGSGDSAAATLAETNAALSTNGTLTVVDLDLSNTVVPTVQSVVPSGTTTGLGSNNAALLSMLSVSPASIAANVGNVNNLSWSFASGSEFFDYLAVGESLTLTYTIRVTDNAGATDDQEVTITITGTNDTPDITVGSGDSAAATLAETNAALSTNGTLTVVDLDLSNTVVPTVQSVVPSGTTTGLGSNNAALLSMLSVSPASIAANVGNVNNLSWSFASGSEFFDYLAVGESLTLTYTIRVTDNAGATDDQEVTITITGTNDTPDITVGSGDSAAATLAETNAALSTNGTLTVVDLDLSNTVVPTVQSVVPSGTTTGLGSNNAALLSMLSVSPASIAANVGNVNNLSWSFASGSEFFDYLAVGESLTLTYTIRVTDNAGATDDQEVTITITGTNDTPDITVGSGDSAAATLAETNAALSTNGTLTVVDLDLSNTVVPTVQSVVPSGTTTGLGSNNAALLSMLSVSPASIAANVGNVNNLSWSFASGSEFFDYLAVGESLTLTYTIRVTDNAGATDDQEVTITITGTNDTPDITVGSGDSAAATLAETNAALSTNGTLTVVDLDLSNTVVPTVQSVVPSGTTTGLGSNNAALLSMLSVSPASIAANVGNVNNLSWSFASGSEFFDYLAVGESLTLTYTIRVTDNAGATDDQEVTITITGTNDTPTLNSIVGGTVAEAVNAAAQLVSIPGAISFADIDVSNTLTPSVVGTPTISASPSFVIPSAVATALTAPGALTFIPASALSGGTSQTLNYTYAPTAVNLDFLRPGDMLTITFTVKVNDGSADSNLQTVVFTITGINDAPVAVADTYSTATNATLNIPSSLGLLANDYDFDGPAISVSQVNGLAANVGSVLTLTKGTLVVQSNGSFVYLPNVNATGIETLNYTITDGSLDSTIGVVISIVGSNHIPIAIGDFASTPRNAPLSVNVLANDFDPDLDPMSVIAVNGVMLPGALPNTSGGGTLSISGGTITYTPALGFVGLDAFSYLISDGRGGFSGAQVLISVTAPANTAPVLSVPTSPVSAGEGSPVTFTATAVDSDTPVQTLTFNLAGAPMGASINSVTGLFSWTPGETFGGTSVTFSVLVSDGLATVSQPVTINVAEVNVPPTVSGPINLGSIPEDSSGITITAAQLLAGGTDVDLPAQTLSISGLTLATAGAGTLSGSGPWTFVPTPNYNGLVVFNFSVSDGVGSTSNAANLFVFAVSDPDTIQPNATLHVSSTNGNGQLTVGAGNSATNFVVATDSADAPGIEIGLRADLRFAGMAPRDPANPTRFYVPAGIAHGTPNGNGIFNDFDDNWARWNYWISINGDTDSDGGTIGELQYRFVFKNLTTGTILGNVTFEQAIAAAVLAANPSATPAQIQATIDFYNNDNLYQDSINFESSFGNAFDPNLPGEYSIEVIAENRSNGTPVLANKIAVIVNHAPAAIADALAATEDTAINFSAAQLLGNDTDANGNPLTIKSVADGTGGTVVLNANGTVTFTPNVDFNGAASFSYVATDGLPINSDSQSVVVTVNVAPVNDAPVLTAIGPKSIQEGSTLNFSAAANDVDNALASLTFSLSGSPSGATISPAGNFSWTLDETQGPGIYDFDVIVSDGAGGTDIETIRVTVNEANQAPMFVTANAVSVPENQLFAISVGATDNDIPIQQLIYGISGGADAARFQLNPVTGVLQFIVAPDFENPTDADINNAYVVEVTVNDGLTTTTQTVTVTVTDILDTAAANQSPVAVNDTASGNEDTTIIGNVLTNDSDSDLTDTLTAVLLTQPVVVVSGNPTTTPAGSVTMLANGEFSYVPAANFNGTAQFTYRLLDGRGGIAVGTVNVTVNPVNDAPVVTPATFTVAENAANGTVVGTVVVNDVDAGDSRAFTLSGPDAAAFAIDSNGQITVNGSLNFELKPTYTFTVNVTDSGLAVGSATVTVNLTDIPETGPKITNVFVNSTAWSPTFRNFVDGGFSDGGVARGFRVSTGSTQLLTLPWINVNQILVQFDSNVQGSLDLGDFVISGVAGVKPDLTPGVIPSVQSYSYNATTNILTLNLTQALEVGQINLGIRSSGVTDQDGNRLFGSWTNGSSTISGSNNVVQDFSFQLNVMPGDVDRDNDVDGTDQTIVQASGSLSPTLGALGSYTIYSDVNGSGGALNTADRTAVQLRVGSAFGA